MRRSLQLSLFALVLLGLVGGTLAFYLAQKAVTVTVDGQARTVGTYADTVGELLEEEGLEPAAHDVVLPAAHQSVDDGDTVVLNRARPLELTVDGVSREVYVTALSVDEALEQLGYRADGLVLSASRSERLPLDGMELSITTPKQIALVADGQERVVTHDGRDRRRPARRAGHRAERDRPHQPLPGAGAARPDAAAGLPGAGERGARSPPRSRSSGSRPPTPTPSRATRRSPSRAQPGEQVTTYRVTVTDGVQTGKEELQLRGHPRAGRRAGHGRHQAAPAPRPRRPRPPTVSTGPRWPPASPVAGRTPSARRARYRGMYQFSQQHLELGRRRRRPGRSLGRRADATARSCSTSARVPVSGRTAVRACSADRAPLTTTPDQPDGLLGPAAIRELAQQLDLRPTKTLGQNFLHDANTIRRIVRTADLRPDDVVLEVGPGLGSLTLGLLPAAAHVTAVEIDPRLAALLPATVAARPRTWPTG